MNTITITSFSDYISYIEHNYGRNHLFRGLKKRAYLLIPKSAVLIMFKDVLGKLSNNYLPYRT